MIYSGTRKVKRGKRFNDPNKWSSLEILTRVATRQRLVEHPDNYYVYILCEPDGTPFYVGKGKGNRVFQHEAEACSLALRSHKLNVIRRIQRGGELIGYALDGFFEIEAQSLARERELIAFFGRFDQQAGPLTNQLDGGEGASNPSSESRARHAASLGGEAEDPERRIANSFLASIAGGQDSVPIKPWRTLSSRAHLLRPSPNKPIPKPTLRMAKALAATAIANQIMLVPGAIVPRQLTIEKVLCILENGCGGDMIHAGMVEPVEPRRNPLEECLRLTQDGYEAVINWLGEDRLIEFGVLEP